MAYDLTAMLTELYARGFNYLNDGGVGVTRATRWLNDAMHAIDDLPDRWPYQEGSASGSGTVTIADLGRIESVQDSGLQRMLTYRRRDSLLEQYGDTSLTGTPLFYYIAGGSTVTVFPVSAGTTLSVKYWKVSADLASGSDQPLMPDRYRMAIVEYAVASGLRDKSNYEEAAGASQAGDVLVERMREFYALQAGGFERQDLVFASEDF